MTVMSKFGVFADASVMIRKCANELQVISVVELPCSSHVRRSPVSSEASDAGRSAGYVTMSNSQHYHM
jgi:hypothetical protein